ncbi:glycoside hydrolase family 43 protein [Fulvivirga ligni]|uniref:glycoside hydrolase family 43 protein n=1 Tax=Fulvivirga ligni TaxID=2904246 RepID=UPI001F349DF4|nr:glycoside hydrolase 43 family protein [Fulvivirga ligni]UII19582.1 glycoside hydrolase 43 family protein [Fulvivirga ligni]
MKTKPNQKCLWLLCLALSISVTTKAQKMHSDNGDGTFTNPVIASDFPDPDVIRVGDTYYMVSTTMFIFPGVSIIQSKDLVNWEYCSNAVPRFEESPCYDLDSCSRYAHGQWATSLKYHNGKFHLLFITLDEGGYHLTADKAEGPWKMEKLPKGFYDPGLFYDDNGKIYVAHGYGDVKITEVDENLRAISKDSLVFKGNIRGGLEGSHVYKLNGYYYLYATYGGRDGIQVALRSKNIWGPYEQKVVIKDLNPGPTFGVHQGALIQTQTGEWWTMLFVDSGPLGRFPSLQPVTWVDGWPMVGENGRGVITYRKPDVGKTYPAKTFPTSSDFDQAELGMQWGWNHNPDDSKWSLKERKGHLRLHTASITTDLKMARNSLTQRTWAYYSDTIPSTAITKLDVSKMADGDVAGLAIFQDPYAYVAVRKTGKMYELVMMNNGEIIETIPLKNEIVYLMAQPDFGSGKASFAYSFDNQSFTKIGNDQNMQFKLNIFTGNKYMLFNYATKSQGGYVDIDWFKVDPTIGYIPEKGETLKL